MAPTDQKKTSKKFTAKDGNVKRSRNAPQGGQNKRKWVQQHKVFEGSVKEGQGFAFKRKEKVRHEYNRLLRKEKKNTRNPESRQLYVEEYPEHLKHLYLAEAEKLKKEAWTNRVNRSKQRMKWQTSDAAVEQEAAAEAQQTKAAEEEVAGGSEPADSLSGSHEPGPEPEPEPAGATAKESLPISNRMKKKMEKKTSFQKTKEEFERIKEKRIKKKEEYLKNQQQREEAIQKYKQKKMEAFQMLSKKTKKGQPNLNLQMEYLLQKIQKK